MYNIYDTERDWRDKTARSVRLYVSIKGTSLDVLQSKFLVVISDFNVFC